MASRTMMVDTPHGRADVTWHAFPNVSRVHVWLEDGSWHQSRGMVGYCIHEMIADALAVDDPSEISAGHETCCDCGDDDCVAQL